MNHPILYGLFLQLRAKGLPLGIKDFFEGLSAISMYQDRFIHLRELLEQALPNKSVDEVGGISIQTRMALTWICQTLWARSPQERNAISKVLNEEIPMADNEIVFDALSEFVENKTQGDSKNHQRNPTKCDHSYKYFDIDDNEFTEPEPTYAPTPLTDTDAMNAGSANNQTSKKISVEDKKVEEKEEKEEKEEQQLTHSKQPTNRNQEQQTNTLGIDTLEVPSASSPGETSLASTMPELGEVPFVAKSVFNWSIEPEVNPLWLFSLWRRLYKPTPCVDQNIIDMDKTLDNYCRTGVLLAPQLGDRVMNTAELLLLIDSSDYMAPWNNVSLLLAQTATSHLSRLKQTHLCYFNKMPGTTLFKDSQLTESIETEKVLHLARQASVMIFSDAGSAANEFDSFRQRRLSKFLNINDLKSGRKIVWLNPMPYNQWLPAFTKQIESNPCIHLCGLNQGDLLQSIEYLRS